MYKDCRVVDLVTPKGFVLDGLWYGTDAPREAWIFVHGLSSSVFAHHDLLTSLVNENVGVLFFNNRGHDEVTGIKKLDGRKKKGYRRVNGGAVFEKFEESEDDIQGAIKWVKGLGVKAVWLVGHSTGSQKSVYFLRKMKNQKEVSGVVLLSPMSDYAAAVKFDKGGKLLNNQRIAKQLLEEGRGEKLMPEESGVGLISVQRWWSLNTPDSIEEIFTYGQPEKMPKLMSRIKVPVLVVLGERDEYRDRSIERIKNWFEKYFTRPGQKVEIIAGATHGFDGKEDSVLETIRKWSAKV